MFALVEGSHTVEAYSRNGRTSVSYLAALTGIVHSLRVIFPLATTFSTFFIPRESVDQRHPHVFAGFLDCYGLAMEHVVRFSGLLAFMSCADHAAFSGIETHKPFLLPSFKALDVPLQLFSIFWHVDYPI